jgi:hypothetical protein
MDLLEVAAEVKPATIPAVIVTADDPEPTDADYDAMAEAAAHLEMACSGHWGF